MFADNWASNPNPSEPPDKIEDVISTASETSRTRTTGELAARIDAAGGVLVVSGNTSDLIVATNNRLSFSVERLLDGRYQITRSSTPALALLGLAAVVGFIFLSRR